MRRAFPVLAAIVLGATAVAAQNLAPIKERKAHFDDIGDAVKPVAAMFKGEQAFELATVQSALTLIREKTAVLPDLFPEDSKEGEDTRALPAIWNDKTDFNNRFKKLADAAEAAEPAMTDEASFKTAWKDLVGNCSGCHKNYRKPKE
ncbi:MAG TPA: cytochrome c [Hyphomicrobium sp.]|nr:cytochrome c [Hyphomicrobium sp.]